MKIDIIISFFNEEENISNLLKQIVKTFKKLNNYNYEIIFVNDCSTDNSVKKIIKNPFTKKIKIINMKKNEGRDECVIVGLKNTTGDLITYMDADLQDPPNLLIKMIRLYEKNKNNDTVIHTIRRTRKGESKFKMAITFLAYKIINLFSYINLPINCGDFKLFTKKALSKCLKHELSDMTYLRGLPFYYGYDQNFIFYDRKKRLKGSSKYPILLSINPIKTFFKALYCFSNIKNFLKIIFINLNLIGSFFIINNIMKIIEIDINKITLIIFLILYFLNSFFIYFIFNKKNLRKKFPIKEIIYLNK